MELPILAGLAYLGIKHEENNKADKKKKDTRRKENGEFKDGVFSKYTTFKGGIDEKIKNKVAQKAKEQKANAQNYKRMFGEYKLTGQNTKPYVKENRSYRNFNPEIRQEELMTNSMMPHTSRRDTSLGEDFSRKLSLQSGVDPFYKHKTLDKFEPNNLFEPQKNLTYVHGMPVVAPYLESRYIPSNKNNYGNLPFKTETLVAPGLNGENQKGRYNTVRILPTNVNIRSKVNPKISYDLDYQGPVKNGEGFRGTEQTITKHKPPAYKVTDPNKDYFPTTATANKQRVAYNLYAKHTNRQDTSREEFGNPHDLSQGKIDRGNYSRSGKISYKQEDFIGGAYDTSQGYTNINDKMRQTIKETTLHSDQRGGLGRSDNNMTYSEWQDQARQTVKETTLHADQRGGLGRSDNNAPYSEWQDEARQTVKQTTLHTDQRGGLGRSEQHRPIVQFQDRAKQTVKQTTLHTAQKGGIGRGDAEAPYAPWQDVAKQTVKQTTLHTAQKGGIGRGDAEAPYAPWQDEARLTVKQTTLHTAQKGGVGREDFGASYAEWQDTARQTVKQTTLHTSQKGGIGRGVSMGSYSIDYADLARPTIKQSTIVNRYTAPLKDQQSKERSRMDAENMELNDTKEILTYSRPSNPKSDIGNNIIFADGVRCRDKTFINRDLYGHKSNNSQVSSLQTRITDKTTINNRVNENMINTHQNNPFSHNINSMN